MTYPWTDGDILYAAHLNRVVIGQASYGTTSSLVFTPSGTASTICVFAKGDTDSGSGTINVALKLDAGTIDTVRCVDTALYERPFALCWQGTTTAAAHTISVAGGNLARVKISVLEVGK